MIALMAVNAVLFGGTFLVLGLYNRLSADDYHYLVTTQEHGIWGGMLEYYQNWNPRWASTLVLNALLLAHSKSHGLLMHGLTLALGWGSLRMLLLGVEERFKLSFSKFQRVVLPFYFLMVLFHVSFAKDDSWFWMSSTPMYLWGIFAMAAGFGLLLVRNASLWHLPLLVVLFLYVGGSSEPVAVVALTVLFYLGILRSKGKNRRLYHIATVSCLIGFGLDALGSGAQVRLDHLPQLPISDRLFIGAKNYGRSVLMKLPLMLPILLAALLPIAVFFRDDERWQVASFKELYVSNRHVFALCDLVLLAIAFMMGLVMSEQGPARAWLPISAMLVVSGVILSSQLGEVLDRLMRRYLFHLVIAFQVLLIGIQLHGAAQMIPTAMTYAVSVDGRMEMIRSAVIRGDELCPLPPLTDAGWLHSAEISADTSDFRNRHLSLYFGNKTRVFVQQTVTSGSE